MPEYVRLELEGAKLGNAMAESEVGAFYYNGGDWGGTVFPRDWSEAKKWWKKAAAKGNSYAINNLNLLQVSSGLSQPIRYHARVKDVGIFEQTKEQ